MRPQYHTLCTPVEFHPKDSPQWHAVRARTLGASEVGAVLGVSTFGGLLGLVLDKRDALAGNPRIWDTPAMAMGRMAESTILGRASEIIGDDIAPGEAVVLGDVSATPDGLIFDELDNVVATVEAKLDRSGKDWQEVATYGFGNLRGRDTRLSYWWQVQAQLHVTGAKKGYLAVWTVYDFFLIEILPDPAAHDIIIEAAKTTLAWVNEPNGRLPEATDTDALSTLARTISPAEEGPVEVSNEVAEAIERYARINADIKRLEEEQDDAKRIILAAHNTASKLVTQGGFRSSFTEASERTTFDSKAFSEANPELYAKFVKITKVSASCRVTAPKKKD